MPRLPTDFALGVLIRAVLPQRGHELGRDRHGAPSRTLGAVRPGRMYDATALRTEGAEELLRRHRDASSEVVAGYQSSPRLPGQVSATPPLTKPAAGSGNRATAR